MLHIVTELMEGGLETRNFKGLFLKKYPNDPTLKIQDFLSEKKKMYRKSTCSFLNFVDAFVFILFTNSQNFDPVVRQSFENKAFEMSIFQASLQELGHYGPVRTTRNFVRFAKKSVNAKPF